MRTLLIALLLAVVAVSAGCTQDMANQPRYNPLRPSRFFTDGRSSRPLVDGTVPRGYLRADTKFYTGLDGGKPISEIPMKMTREDLKRGQERFNINCSPCHDRTGYGSGLVAQRGLKHPPSYHIDRLRNAPIGYFYDVMTRGFGAMPSAADRVTPEDRWRIAAYVRALQLSQNAGVADIPAEEKAKLP